MSKINMRDVAKLPAGDDLDDHMPKRIADPELYRVMESAMGISDVNDDDDDDGKGMTSIYELCQLLMEGN